MRSLVEIHSCLVVAIELTLKMTQTDEHISLAQAVVDRLVNRTRFGKRSARLVVATEIALKFAQAQEYVGLAQLAVDRLVEQERLGKGGCALDRGDRDRAQVYPGPGVR